MWKYGNNMGQLVAAYEITTWQYGNHMWQIGDNMWLYGNNMEQYGNNMWQHGNSMLQYGNSMWQYGNNMGQYAYMVTAWERCFCYSLQFLAHDTDSSSQLPTRDFDILSDVKLPIPVPKVSSMNISNGFI